MLYPFHRTWITLFYLFFLNLSREECVSNFCPMLSSASFSHCCLSLNSIANGCTWNKNVSLLRSLCTFLVCALAHFMDFNISMYCDAISNIFGKLVCILSSNSVLLFIQIGTVAFIKLWELYNIRTRKNHRHHVFKLSTHWNNLGMFTELQVMSLCLSWYL